METLVVDIVLFIAGGAFGYWIAVQEKRRNRASNPANNGKKAG